MATRGACVMDDQGEDEAYEDEAGEAMLDNAKEIAVILKAVASRLTVRQGDYDAALDCSGCEYIFQVGESYYLITLQDCLTIMIFCEDCYGTYAKAAVSEN